MTGVALSAYSTLTPFEFGSNDFTVLKPLANLAQSASRVAGTTANVACVTCHRAHAGGFESMLRFFYLNEFMTIGDSTGTASYAPLSAGNRSTGLSPVQVQRAYYERPASTFGPWARLQCNKCHAQD
jgi:hypothetical protein